MKKILFFIFLPILLSYSANAQTPTPFSEWRFDNSANLTAATAGSNLELVGSHTAVSGPDNSEGAVRIGSGSHYKLSHGLTPNEGTYVNTYSILYDFKVEDLYNWRSFFQTNSDNRDDAELFIHIDQGTLGRNSTGYSTTEVTPNIWNRLVVVVNNGTEYSLYLNGTKILTGIPQAIDGDYALRPTMLLFADNDGEDGIIDVARVSLYDEALSEAEVQSLGILSNPIPTNPAPKNPFLTKAYLQNATTDAITIMWESNSNAQGTVNYGPSSESYSNKATSTVRVTNANTYVHKAKILGLLEGTTYYYKVTTNGQSNSEQTFKTATSDVNASFKVGIWGDSHYAEPFDAMASYLVDKEQVDFCVNTGDISNSGNRRSDLNKVFLPIVLDKISSKVPVYAALGNHDVGSTWGGGDLIRQYLDQPTAHNSDPSNFNGSYAFRYGNSVFITIDWNKMNTNADNDLVADGWLENVLSDPISTGAKYRFIFMHCGPYYERWQEAETHRLETPVKELLPALAEKYGVTAVFSGHMHGYERGYKGDVHYVTQGGGSYMDNGEPIGDRYDFIIRGTDKDGGIANFNNGLTNHVLTLEITPTTAQFKLHYFNKDGTYSGLKETVPMF